MSTISKSLHVLIIEDNIGDFVLLEDFLQMTDLNFSAITHASFLTEGLEMIMRSKPDIIFLDLFLPDSSGKESFTKMNAAVPDIPIIVLSGLADSNVALEAIAGGAQDFLVKGEFSAPLLQKTILYSLERKQSEKNLRISNERYELLSKATNDAVWDCDILSDNLYWNENLKNLFGLNPEEVNTGKKWELFIHPDDAERVINKIEYHINNGIKNWQDEYRFRCADGSYKDVLDRGFILFENNSPSRMIGATQDITEFKNLQKKINADAIARQRDLSQATLQGQEKERSEIGKELHDNVNQVLAAVKLFLNIAAQQNELKDEMIEKSSQKISYCIEEIRKLSKSLLPPSLAEDTLDDALYDLVNTITVASDLQVDILVDSYDYSQCSEVLQVNVYRIVQEQMNNILKYSKAQNVIIGLRVKHNVLELSIKDNGVGFDLNVKKTGIGLKNIQSRVQMLDGELKIITAPNEGCIIEVKIPLVANLAGTMDASIQQLEAS